MERNMNKAAIDELVNIRNRIANDADHLTNEEQTKIYLIFPFIEKVLGYDCPATLHAEDSTDAPTDKKRVDYSCYDKNGHRRIVVECKPLTDALKTHLNQLNNYFANTKSDIGILTNGKEYRFYCSDGDEAWLAKEPFFAIDLTNLSKIDEKFIELISFDNYNIQSINRFIEANEILNSLGFSLENINNNNHKNNERQHKKSNRRPDFKFSMIDLKPGDKITYKDDDSKVAIVYDDTKVCYNGGTPQYLTTLAKKLSGRTVGVQGSKFFKHNGIILDNLRTQKETSTHLQ